MPDSLNRERRSWNMSRIRAWNTAPERAVRSILHRLGFRFRIHEKRLPGKPDIVLPRHQAVVQVHGCFWHRHSKCRFAYAPKTNTEKWNRKFRENVARDTRTARELVRLGWHVITVWECELADPEALADKLATKLDRRELEKSEAVVG